ncbi:hydantoinase/oxoprolinase N-terminal domain-containing protein [Biostraticola tofi]|uniref:N-methylhydantoinase A/oxoprolinase/acetone carboxylase beta subunit n=1 Tax=Biostraticola tofi TaxID=466109 RepID=A0A4R3YVL4_9GAMM|nr:hydantoinase/oxoprolinase family protein [Biostraticola tofi]TCV95444.1 N-methylhydantoinase A/oxoprolinase/acetone carboxylase beta subunit [Biostraticola tofi]
MSYHLGIDVGGTNTDAVLLDRSTRKVIARTKKPTTADIISGVEQAIGSLLGKANVIKSDIKLAMLGTTCCTNAIVERKDLNSVAHFRLGAPSTTAILPFSDIPDDFRRHMATRLFVVAGGMEYNGDILSPLDEDTLRCHLREIKGEIDAVSVCGVFSPVRSIQEQRAATVIREELGSDIPISLSSQIGSLGLLERENASILNAALFNTARHITKGFHLALEKHAINAETYFSQNDGTLMSLEQAEKYPILTIASGPTNSIRGASWLANVQNALIIDIGGTTTDVGFLVNGFPRESCIAAQIGGVRTNFRMPDIESIGLGGGTIVTITDTGDIQIGPESVGYRLTEKSLVFGGDILTLTDIAVAKGQNILGDPGRVSHLSASLVNRVFKHYVEMIENVIDRMKTHAAPVPVILVGGGAFLLPTCLRGAAEVITPPNADVANAAGVTIAQVSGSVDTIMCLGNKSLDACMLEAQEAARQKAVAAGAQPDTVVIIDLQSMPLAYMPGNSVRIRAKAVGMLTSLC